ncbi:MAG: extracellular solute-binding protein [Acetatifactor sp.]|nr:extracellular solute-binding protein [Acetatifactor sp.]
MKSKGFASLILLCVGLSIGACGRNSQSGEQNAMIGEEARRAQLVEKQLPDADEALIDCLPENGSVSEFFWDMNGDTVYRFVKLLANEGWTEGYCLQRLDAPYESWECQTIGLTDWAEDGTQHYVSKATFGKDGKLQLLLDDYDEKQFFWADWTLEDGFRVPDIMIPGTMVNAELLSYDKNWYIDGDQNSYLYLDREFQYYDSDFSTVEYGNPAMQGQFMQALETDNGMYMCGSDENNYFTIWDIATGEKIYSFNTFGNMHPDGRVIYISEEEAYLCNPMTIVRFSVQDGTEEYLLNFENEGYSIDRVYGGTVTESGSLLMLVETNGRITLLELPREGKLQKTEMLEAAMIYASPFLQELVADFNKSNSNYQIVLRTPDQGEDWNDYRNRIVEEISTGEGPDLLDGYLLNVSEAVRKGYLKDMTEYCDQSKKEIWQSAWKTGEVNGKNYMIPYKCSLRTLVTGEKIAGKWSSWNLEKVEQCMKDNGYSGALGSLDQGVLEKESVFFYLGIFPQSKTGFIDWKKGTSHLNDAKALQLMELLKEQAYSGEKEEYGAAIAKGEIPAVMAAIRGVDSLQLLGALFKDKEVYIGFPAEKGEANSFLACDGFVVNQSNANAEGVQAFLTYLLSDEVQDKIAEKSSQGFAAEGLPVRKNAMDLFCDYALEGKYVNSDFVGVNTFYGYDYVSEVLTEENIRKFRTAFEGAGAIPEVDDIYSIIGEEAPAYFDGDKSAQEVADIMNNRIQLYLDEH